MTTTCELRKFFFNLKKLHPPHFKLLVMESKSHHTQYGNNDTQHHTCPNQFLAYSKTIRNIHLIIITIEKSPALRQDGLTDIKGRRYNTRVCTVTASMVKIR